MVYSTSIFGSWNSHWLMARQRSRWIWNDLSRGPSRPREAVAHLLIEFGSVLPAGEKGFASRPPMHRGNPVKTPGATTFFKYSMQLHEIPPFFGEATPISRIFLKNRISLI
jgi:hypothetical protein